MKPLKAFKPVNSVQVYSWVHVSENPLGLYIPWNKNYVTNCINSTHTFETVLARKVLNTRKVAVISTTLVSWFLWSQTFTNSAQLALKVWVSHIWRQTWPVTLGKKQIGPFLISLSNQLIGINRATVLQNYVFLIYSKIFAFIITNMLP